MTPIGRRIRRLVGVGPPALGAVAPTPRTRPALVSERRLGRVPGRRRVGPGRRPRVLTVSPVTREEGYETTDGAVVPRTEVHGSVPRDGSPVGPVQPVRGHGRGRGRGTPLPVGVGWVPRTGKEAPTGRRDRDPEPRTPFNGRGQEPKELSLTPDWDGRTVCTPNLNYSSPRQSDSVHRHRNRTGEWGPDTDTGEKGVGSDSYLRVS